MATTKAAKQEQATAQDESATEVVEYELPPGYELESAGFRRAFEHAKRHGNGDKVSLLFAQAHAYHFEETGDGDV